MSILNKLAGLANELDKKRLFSHADKIDSILKRASTRDIMTKILTDVMIDGIDGDGFEGNEIGGIIRLTPTSDSNMASYTIDTNMDGEYLQMRISKNAGQGTSVHIGNITYRYDGGFGDGRDKGYVLDHKPSHEIPDHVLQVCSQIANSAERFRGHNRA